LIIWNRLLVNTDFDLHLSGKETSSTLDYWRLDASFGKVLMLHAF